MKHSFFMKAIAFLLCAVSLLGIVGSGLGIFFLTEGNLYNRTVDQMLEEQIHAQGQSMAQALASRYASANLGGTAVQLVENRFPLYRYGILSGSYGYAILDSEGTVLESAGQTDPDQTSVYRFPVNGQYIHQVSLMSESEKFPAYQSDPTTYTNAIMTDSLYLYEAVPPEGASVTDIILSYSDGPALDYSTGEILGSVYYTRDGFLVGRFTDPHGMLRVNKTITDLVLAYHGDLLVEARSAAGVGHFTRDVKTGEIVFYSNIRVEDLVNPQTETVPETTVEESQPQETTVPETVPETTVPETTVPEIVMHVEDHIPADGLAEVMELYIILEDDEEIFHQDEFGIGRIRRLEDGSVLFTSYENWEAETGDVIYITTKDAQGDVIFKAESKESIGKFYYNDDDQLTFQSIVPKPPVEETVPETVPETAAQTIPETTAETVAETTVTVTEETVPPTEPVIINGKPLWEYEINTDTYFDPVSQQTMHGEFVYLTMPEYTVELYLSDASFQYGAFYEILRIVRSFRNYLLPILIGCILVCLAAFAWLVWTAAHKRGSDILHAGGLNRIPLDLYLVLLGLGIPCLCVMAYEGSLYLISQSITLVCACAIGCAFTGCLLVVGFLFAAVAQFKTPNGYWYRNSVCGRFIRICFLLMSCLEQKGRMVFFPFLSKAGQKFWMFTCTCLVWLYRSTEKFLLRTGRILGRFLTWFKEVLHRFLTLLPLTWQWLMSGFLLLLLIGMIFATNGEELLTVLCIFGSISLILYGAHCFGTLLDSTKKMRKGNLDTKVDDKMMVGSFKEFAGELNELAGVAVVAAQKQLNSERMKSELITNVSHDIKTPLTSIINYVDLLQRPHTEEDGEAYLEVLSRQSLQLKKLLDDLMDMSKASTGNMNVEITRLDAVESITQALGEFSDKLEKARLVPVFRHTDPFVPMMADGRLVWRVLNNLLSNAVKYAMPGTRLYLDLMEMDGNVVISLKNISREELTADAAELMERFVRGDDSRNTEGSGLGLNIAKSLMELQKGQMQLLVDGDLFKVTLIFPGA